MVSADDIGITRLWMLELSLGQILCRLHFRDYIVVIDIGGLYNATMTNFLVEDAIA